MLNNLLTKVRRRYYSRKKPNSNKISQPLKSSSPSTTGLTNNELILLATLLSLILIYIIKKLFWPKTPTLNHFTHYNVDTTVIGGNTAEPNRYTFMANLMFENNFPHCGASLISPTFLLTAAHCVVFDGIVNRPDRVLLNRFDLTAREPEAEMLTPIKVFIHPEYVERTISYDIALVQLLEPSKFAPIKIADEKVIAFLQETDIKATVLGFGQVSYGWPYPSPVLMEADLSLVPIQTCRSLWVDYLREVDRKISEANLEAVLGINAKMSICANSKRKAPCFGDSGGPIFFKATPQHQTGKTSMEVDLLIGVISFVPNGCVHSSVPSVFANAVAARSWINEVIGGTLADVDVLLPVKDESFWKYVIASTAVTSIVFGAVYYILLQSSRTIDGEGFENPDTFQREIPSYNAQRREKTLLYLENTEINPEQNQVEAEEQMNEKRQAVELNEKQI